MSFISGDIGIYSERLTVALGFLTLAFAAATFASCRSCLAFLERLGIKGLTEKRWYRPFYKYHGYYWWAFFVVLALHFLTALMHTGIPSADDPDARIHWVVLAFGLGSLGMVGTALSSCRSFTGLVNIFTGKSLLGNGRYLSFYRYHSYYWLVLVMAIAGHFVTAVLHVGFWPG